MIAKILGSSALCFALLVSASLVQAFPGDNAYNDKRAPWGQQLSPQQKQLAEKIFNDNFENMNDTREALAMKRQQLNDELNSDNPNPAEIERLSKEIGELRGKMLAARVAVRSQLAKEGLPEDFYGPNVSARKQKKRGPEVWEGYPHHRPRGWHHGGHRFYGCPGMMGW